MDWGTKTDTPYSFYIRRKDRDVVIEIIKTGLFEYISENFFDDQEEERYYKTSELCNVASGITFSSLIHNSDELLNYRTDARGSNTLQVVFGECGSNNVFKDAESILGTYILN